MTRILIIPLMVLIYCAGTEAAGRIDSALKMLDVAIREIPSYEVSRIERISRLRKALEATPGVSAERYRINGDLYTEYSKYKFDSALYFLKENLAVSMMLKDTVRILTTRLEMCHRLASGGLYIEAADILRDIESSHIPESLRFKYFQTKENLYFQSGKAKAQHSPLSAVYRKIACQYRDSILAGSDTLNSDVRDLQRVRQYIERGKFEEALAHNTRLINSEKPGTFRYSLLAYNQQLIYDSMGRDNDRIFYLAMAAIADIRQSCRDQSALLRLAEVLYRKGDVTRSHSYITTSWHQAQLYNSRMRQWANVDALSMINTSYNEIMKRNNRYLVIIVFIVGALAIIVFIELLILRKNKKKLSQANKELEKRNEDVNVLNGMLERNNGELKNANDELREAAKVKEAYLAYFFQGSSDYLNRLRSFRKQIINKVKGGASREELLKLSGSGVDIDALELNELYSNFDTAFLKVYPTFVEKFNELLIPEERIILNPGEKLNTELRIFALIRLGIKDSARIASLLRYSVNTIYNYRAKVKSKSAVPRENFEELLLKIQ